jgi:LDH2 family malate/lactate/ureidoglycolate dehydrogenase
MYNGVFALVIEPTFFRPVAYYKAPVDNLFQRVKNALPAQGKQGTLIPGEPEADCKAAREQAGISIDDNTLREPREIATSVGVQI